MCSQHVRYVFGNVVVGMRVESGEAGLLFKTLRGQAKGIADNS